MIETAKLETDKFLVQTRSQTKSSGIKVLEVHSIDNGLKLHVKPERQKSVAMLPADKNPPIDKTLHPHQCLYKHLSLQY